MATLGKNTVVLHDQYNLTTALDSGEVSASLEPLETTTFSANSKTFTPGTKDGTISVEGLSDATSATGIDSIQYADLGNTSTLVTLSAGSTAGSTAYLADTTQNAWAIAADVSGLVRINGAYQTVQDGVEKGVLVLPVTTATATANGATHDRGASSTSSSGNVAMLHVTAASGTSPTLDVDIEMDDNSSFTSATTLVSFAQATAATVERMENTTSTERYLRVAYTIGGTDPSFTLAVSWAAR